VLNAQRKRKRKKKKKKKYKKKKKTQKIIGCCFFGHGAAVIFEAHMF